MKKIVLLFIVIVCFAQDGWERMDLPEGNIVDIKVAPSNSDVIYVLLYDAGLYRTTDRGSAWHLTTADSVLNPTDLLPTKIGIAYDNTDYLYAFPVYTDSFDYGFSRSTDGGFTWEVMSYTLEMRAGANEIDIDRRDHNIVYTGGEGAPYFYLRCSHDAGRTWSYLGDRLIHGYEVSISDPNIIYLANYRIDVSDDHGYSWSTGLDHYDGVMWDMVADPFNPDILFFRTGRIAYSFDMGNTIEEIDTSIDIYDFAMNSQNSSNWIFTDRSDESPVRADKILISRDRIRSIDTLWIEPRRSDMQTNKLAVSSGYNADIRPDADYLFCVLQDSTEARVLFRKDITAYGSARHYYHIERGWNLLSWCPRRDAPDALEAVADLFSEAILPAYAWNAELGTYDAIDSLSPTQGFWLLSDSARVIEQDGLMTMDTVTVTLRRGWNLIGVQAVPLFADSLESLSVVVPPIYKWKDGAYQEASALVPESGYWVLCSDSLSIGIR